jgi:large conductance mechanosensitive channel
LVVVVSSNEQQKMLEELRKIRELLEPKLAPPPPPAVKKTFGQEFMNFLNKYGVIGLAVAFIIGGAAGTLISAMVNDLLMPLINPLLQGGEWQKAELVLGPVRLLVGHFVGALINFIIIALVVFVLMKQLSKTGLK